MSDAKLRRILKIDYGEDSYELGGYINFMFKGQMRHFPMYLEDYKELFVDMLTPLEKELF